MCRNIRPLSNFSPPATDDEVSAAALQDVRKISGTALLAAPAIERVTYLHIEYVGPNRLFIVAEIDLAGDAVVTAVERLREYPR